jgi:tetratricopeptide (TPR) repeat protein
VAVAATHGLNEATVNYLLAALVDKSIVMVSFPGGVARYALLDSVRDYVLDRLEEDGSIGAVRAAHAACFAQLAEDARAGLRGPDWRRWQLRLHGENDNLWAALGYARETQDGHAAARLGTLGWYFTLDERVSEGRRFLELARAATTDDAPVDQRVDLLATLCYLATEELDLGAALAVGERALELAAPGGASRHLGLAQLALGYALAHAGDAERSVTTAQAAVVTLEEVGDDWGAAAAALIRASAAAHAGDVATVAEMTEIVRRHADAIDYDAFGVPALLLEAWGAERRSLFEAAEETYVRAGELARSIGFGDHAAFAVAQRAGLLLARGDLPAAGELAHEALAAAEAAGAPWPAALARVQLARVGAATGDEKTAAELYREVLAWSDAQRPHEARESLFVALAGTPAAPALLGLAELAEAGGDTAAADELRVRAALALT